MTTERWDDARLDRLASLVEGIAQRVEANTNSIASLNQRTENIVDAVDRLAQVQLQTLQRIDEIQQEVRGLQVESHRILDYLFNQRGDAQDN